MMGHSDLRELNYTAIDNDQKQLDMPKYHLVQSCIPKDVPINECSAKGYMFLVIGQEQYQDSPFTKEILKIVNDDVKKYYGYIVLIFFVVKFFLFVVLWSWLRIRVTERMIALTKKLKTNDQSEKHNYQAVKISRDTEQDYRKEGVRGRSSFFVTSSGEISTHRN